ncbi:hypothetical protein ABMA28_007890 [Loxostege sticticalis]|uniref:Uncharacterized protein n=1 Tax=Loxostege sticticalis TaxID=481309 RepID=A0ABD0SJ50_LOXSC
MITRSKSKAMSHVAQNITSSETHDIPSSQSRVAHDMPSSSHLLPPSPQDHAPVEPQVEAFSFGSRRAGDEDATSMRSAQAASVRSSLSVKARKAAAVAAFQRRRYEQQKQLAQQLAEVEQAELDAELERIDMEAEDVRSHRSRSSSLSVRQTEKWAGLYPYSTPGASRI